MDSEELYQKIRENVKEWQKTKSVSLAATTMELLAEVLKEHK